MKLALPTRRKRGVYTVTDARRSMSEDISYRQRRYLISMGVRVVAFLLAVFLFHGVWRFIAAAIALVVPYFAVVFANGGREPESTASFESFEPNLPERAGGARGRAVSEGIAGDRSSRDGDPADGTATADAATDGTVADATGRDDIGRDGTVSDGAATERSTPEAPAASAGTANHAARNQGDARWNASWHGDPGMREGEAFLSGKQADSRS